MEKEHVITDEPLVNRIKELEAQLKTAYSDLLINSARETQQVEARLARYEQAMKDCLHYSKYTNAGENISAILQNALLEQPNGIESQYPPAHWPAFEEDES